MPEPSGRKTPKKLSAEVEWEIFLSVTAVEALPGRCRPQVGRGPVHRIGICRTVRDAALAALARDRDGRPAASGTGSRRRPGPRSACWARRSIPGHRADGGEEKSRLGLIGPLPARVPAETKELVLKSVDEAVSAGFSHTWACWLWRVADDRVHRWRARLRDVGTLIDRAPGGHPVHGCCRPRWRPFWPWSRPGGRWTAPAAGRAGWRRPTAAPCATPPRRGRAGSSTGR